MKKKLLLLFLIISKIVASQSIHFDNNSYISLKSGGYVFIKDTSVNAIQTLGGGFFIPDTLNGYVEWEVENNKGKYTVPYLSYDNLYFPISLNISAAGLGTSIKFLTIDTFINRTNQYYNTISIGRYWNINLSNYITKPQGTVTLKYDTTRYPYSSVYLNYYNSSNVWEQLYLNAYTSGTASFVLDTTKTNVRLTLLNTNFGLPIQLVYFKGEAIENKYSHLYWQTATETNNKGFIIEKSKNALDFDSIGWVDGQNNSNWYNEYQFNDYDIKPNNTYYYRLKQIDFNNEYSYVHIIYIKFISTPEVIEYYNILGQRIYTINNAGFYIKVSNTKSKLFIKI